MLSLKIAFRNIFRHKTRSLLTGAMMAGGCALFSMFIGMVDGSYDSIIRMFTRDRTGHVQIHSDDYLDKPSIYKRINDPLAVGQRAISTGHVEALAPRVYGPALAFSETKTRGITIYGIDPVREPRVTTVKEKVMEGSFISNAPLNEVLIDRNTSRVLKADIGSEIAIISQSADGSIANDLFTVVGVFNSAGGSYTSSSVYMHIDTAREFLALGNTAHEITILLDSHRLARQAAMDIARAIADTGLDVQPWQVVEKQFYQAMMADIKGNWVTMVVFTIIICLGVLNTVLMVILERTREFGVLKAIGTRPTGIFRLIVLETMILALMSAAAGVIIGIIINAYLYRYGIHLPEPVEYGGVIFDRLTARVTFRSMALPAFVIITSAALVSILPAIRAARTVPARAIRTD